MEFEREFIQQKTADLTMTFQAFVKTFNQLDELGKRKLFGKVELAEKDYKGVLKIREYFKSDVGKRAYAEWLVEKEKAIAEKASWTGDGRVYGSPVLYTGTLYLHSLNAIY